MSKTKSTAKLVITSVILSLIVLAIFTLVFLKYIVPVYSITEKQVYDVLVKLFPILVGLALIQIGIIAVIGISLLVIFSVTLAYFSAVADQNINNNNNVATAIINE